MDRSVATTRVWALRLPSRDITQIAVGSSWFLLPLEVMTQRVPAMARLVEPWIGGRGRASLLLVGRVRKDEAGNLRVLNC